MTELDDPKNVEDFRIAIMRDDLTSVRKWLKTGINVDTTFSSGWTPLMYAANNAMSDCIRSLLEYKANHNCHKDCYTVLMCACSSTKKSEAVVLECVNQLLEAGSDVNVFDKYGMSALMYAAREGHASVVKRLIDANACTNRQDNKGNSALMWAAQRCRLRVVEVLVECGADLKLEKRDKTTALDIARQVDNQAIIDVILKALGLAEGAQPPSPTLPSKPTETASGNSVQVLPVAASPQTDYVSPFSWDLPTAIRTKSPPPKRDPISVLSELDLFLTGLDLSALIPVFHENDVSFNTFLRMSDDDLRQTGVKRAEDRSQILDAIKIVHKPAWQAPTLTNVNYVRKINYNEGISMMSNIKGHMTYMISLIEEVSDRIEQDKLIVHSAPDGVGVQELVTNAEEASKAVEGLYHELVQLRCQVGKIYNTEEFVPTELVKPRRAGQMGLRGRFVVFATGFGILAVTATCVFTRYVR